jgi:hypothetical protein
MTATTSLAPLLQSFFTSRYFSRHGASEVEAGRTEG